MRKPSCHFYSGCLGVAARADSVFNCCGCSWYAPTDCYPAHPELIGLLALVRAICAEDVYTDQTPQHLIGEIKDAIPGSDPYLNDYSA